MKLNINWTASGPFSWARRLGFGFVACIVGLGCNSASPKSNEAAPGRIAESHQALIGAAFTPDQPNIKWHGRIQSMDADPTNPNIAIAASDHGGAFKTIDGGLTWTRLDGLKPNMLADVAVCPDNSQYIAVTAFQTLGTTTDSDTGGIWLSADGGTTWARSPIAGHGNTSHSGFGVDYLPGSNCQTVFAGTSFGLAECTVPGASCISRELPDHEAVYAVVARPGPIVHTHTDTGYRRWDGSIATPDWNDKCNPLDSTNPCPAGLVPSPATTYFPQVNTLVVSPLNEDVLFASGNTIDNGSLTHDYQLYESDNGGTSWTDLGMYRKAASRLTFVAIAPTRLPGQPDDFDLYFSNGPNMERTTCTEDWGSTLRCGSGTVTWETIFLRSPFAGEGDPPYPHDGTTCGDNATTPCTHEDPSGIFFDPTNHCPLYMSGDGGVMKLAESASPPDCGQTGDWATIGSGLHALQLFEVAGQVHTDADVRTDLFIATQDDGVWASVPVSGSEELAWTPAGLEGGFMSVPHSEPNRDNTLVTYYLGSGVMEARAGFQPRPGSPPDDPWFRALRWSYIPGYNGAPDGLGKNRVVCADLDGDNHCDGLSASVECSTVSALPNPGVTCISSACAKRAEVEDPLYLNIESDFCRRMDFITGANPVAVVPGAYLQWDGGAYDAANRLVAPNQLHRSTDFGVSWEPVPGVALGNVGDDAAAIQKPDGLGTISRDPNGKYIAYFQTAGPKGGMIRVDDVLGAGPTLDLAFDTDLYLPPLTLSYSSAFVGTLSVGIHPENPDLGFAATVFGVRKWNEAGHKWEVDEGTAQLDKLVADKFAPTNLISWGFDPTDTNRIIAGTAESGAMSSLDGGQTWARLCGSDTIPLITRFFFDEVENHVYASSWGRGLWTVDLTKQQIPVFTTAPSDVTVQNCGPVDIGQAQAEDQCEDTPISVDVKAGLDADPSEPYAGCEDGTRPCGDFRRGVTTVPWTAVDGYGDISTTTSTVTVDDTTPPLVTPPADVTTAICGVSGLITVGEATAVDTCVGDVAVSGQVISSNGETLTTPIDVIDGEVTLGIGTHVIEWTATDGITEGSATQTVVVGGAIQANNLFTVEDRGHVLDADGNPAAVLNSGGGPTSIGGDGATVGDIVAGGAVNVNPEGVVVGDITAVGPVYAPTFGGTINTVTDVPLPAMPTLPTFPPPTGGDVTVGPGESVPLPPGYYAEYTLNGNQSDEQFLVLSSGDYYFTALRMNADANILAEIGTRIFVSGEFLLNDRAAILLNGGGGELAPVYLGLAGSGETVIESSFTGTIVAPNRTLIFGTADDRYFTGSFFADSIHMMPGATMVCSAQTMPGLSCNDGVKNGDETDEDCGGSCLPCSDGSDCIVNADCSSKVCIDGTCNAPTCSDGVQNGDEEDVDCGGTTCAPCVVDCNDATYEAESIYHSAGGAYGTNAWNIWTNGFISTTHDFTPGPALVTVSALGEGAFGVPAHMAVTVGGLPIGDASVANGAFNDYDFYFTAVGGPEEVRVIFDNDLYTPPWDRNLIVDNFSVDCN